MSSRNLSDQIVAEDIGDEFGSVDDDAVEVEIKTELVEDHVGSQVEEVAGQEDQRHAYRGGSQGGEPEQIQKAEDPLVFVAHFLDVFLFES